MSDKEQIILIVDDNANNLQVLFQALQPLGRKTLIAKNGEQALKIARNVIPAVILLDVMMPDKDGYEVCKELKEDEATNDISILFISALGQAEDKIKGLELGALDFISKPFKAEEVLSRVKTHLKLNSLTEELKHHNKKLSHELNIVKHFHEEANKHVSGPLLGTSSSVQKLKSEIKEAASLSRPTLLIGKPGCGADAVAREIHNQSKHKSAAFIYMNCATLSQSSENISQEQTLEKFELAQGGTLFLDQITQLSMDSQKLLSEYIETHLLGENKTQTMLICHSPRDLEKDLTDAKFSQKLYYLITDKMISLPRLIERSGDISEVAHFYARNHADKIGKSITGISEESIKMLSDYTWPGNFTEREVATTKSSEISISDASFEGKMSIGGYRLKKMLAGGGMGEVWIAEHNLLARPAAVKLIKNNILNTASSESLIKRFQREAQSTANLKSPHTVTLYDYGVSDNGDFFYVMELLDGMSLEDMIKRFGSISQGRAIYFFKQACKSLAEAHNMGMVHRDIKPDNLFVAKLGEEVDFLKVLDLGIVSSNEEEDPMLTAGQPLGTPAFISPEIAQGRAIQGKMGH